MAIRREDDRWLLSLGDSGLVFVRKSIVGGMLFDHDVGRMIVGDGIRNGHTWYQC